MLWLLLAIFGTVFASFTCSLFEALILSTSGSDIAALKRSHARRSELLEIMRQEIDTTISAILTLNTTANAIGSLMIGALGAQVFGEELFALIAIGFGAAMLVVGEVLPKSLAVVHHKALLPLAIYPLWWARRVLIPITYLCNLAVRLIVKEPPTSRHSDEEIILLAERGAQQGTLSKSESSIIANALSLDNVRVSEIMTPRTVVTALRKQTTIGEVFREFPNLPFGRMPVYGRNLDDIVGLARRRDLLKAKANDQDLVLVESLMHEIHFVPETITVANALQVFLKTHQQLLVVVDEFGATAGVVTMEDVMEQLLGREIFEKDDVAVDMRELARAKQQKQTRPKKPEAPKPPSPTSTPFPTA